jgi:soluble lytic murein transglycosylase
MPLPKREIKSLKKYRDTRHLGDQISRALQLVSVGEEGLARAQSNKLCHGQNHRLIKRRLGKAQLYRLCDALLFYTGDHGKRWKRQASRRIGWRSGISKRTPQERAESYPLAYYDLSVAAAEVEKISPWWLMSHMLQESRYRPEVVSYAQAIGLMQILGRTGKRIHERMKWPQGAFFSDQLYDPALSIRYAAWYLRRLSDDLGHTMLAIGAYNGGPMRFADHQDEFQGHPFDVMVEEMGAHESRNYLRKVTDHFVRYLALYASDQEWERWTQRLAPPQYTPKAKRIVGF